MEGSNHLQHYLQILADMNRLKIISLIGKSELSVTEIVSGMQLSQSLVSHHLRVLKDNQILETRRAGPFIYYRLKNTELLDVLGLLAEVLPKDSNQEDVAAMFMCPPWFQKFFDRY